MRLYTLDDIDLREYILEVAWDVQFGPMFEAWLEEQDEAAQDDIAVSLILLREHGPLLARPHADTLTGSQYPNMKELRVQSNGRPIRIFFAFDPTRSAIVLVAGDKTNEKRFYKEMVLIADRLYAEHLAKLPKDNDHG